MKKAMPYSYTSKDTQTLKEFAYGPTDAYPLLTDHRNRVSEPNPSNEWATNPFMEQGPQPLWRDRNSAQFNTDLHLPPNLFKPNRAAVFQEDLTGPPLPVQPEPYHNKNFMGTLRNYTSLADKVRGAHGAYNGYLPPMEKSGEFPSVWEGFDSGYQKTERRRRNYYLTQVPYQGELKRNTVPLTPQLCNVWPNRDRFTSNTWAFPESLYNPAYVESGNAGACVVDINGHNYEAYTHGGVGEERYWKNEGVGEEYERYDVYRPEWIGYQWIPNEGGHVTSVMKPNNKMLMEEGIRWTGQRNFIYPD
jgi:hypothetical protein